MSIQRFKYTAMPETVKYLSYGVASPNNVLKGKNRSHKLAHATCIKSAQVCSIAFGLGTGIV